MDVKQLSNWTVGEQRWQPPVSFNGCDDYHEFLSVTKCHFSQMFEFRNHYSSLKFSHDMDSCNVFYKTLYENKARYYASEKRRFVYEVNGELFKLCYHPLLLKAQLSIFQVLNNVSCMALHVIRISKWV